MTHVLAGRFPALAACVVLAVISSALLYVQPLIALALVPASVICAVLLVRPTLALPFVFLAIMVSDASFLTPYTVTLIVPLTVSKLSMLMVLALWFAHCLATSTWPLRNNSMWLPLGAMLAALLLGSIQLRSLGSGMNLVIGFALLMTLCHVLDAIADARHLRTALTAVAVIYVVVVFASLFFGYVTEGMQLTRYSGFSMNANEWSLMVLIGLCPVVAIFETSGNKLALIGSMLAILLASAAVLLAVSRSGMLVLAAMSPVLILILGKRSWLMVTVAVVMGLYLVDFSAAVERFDSFFDAAELEMDGSIRDRALAGRFAWLAFLEHPLFGIGTGAFTTESAMISGGQIAVNTHNTYLQVLAELGVVGAVLCVATPIAILRSIYRSYTGQQSKRFRRLVLGFVGSFVCFFLMIFTINAITAAVPFFILALLMAVERASGLSSEELVECRLA
ncbi:MAG: O-antigen ligase family protein [Myxococcota bacterium]